MKKITNQRNQWLKQALLIVLLATGLAGCSATTLTAPCPNYGAGCAKVPVNSWNNT